MVVIGHMICRATDPIHQLVANDLGHARGGAGTASHVGLQCFVFQAFVFLLLSDVCREFDMGRGTSLLPFFLPLFFCLSFFHRRSFLF